MTCKDCLHCEACEGTYRYYDDEYINEVSFSGDVRDLCTIFKNKADFVEVVRCKDCDIPHNKWTGCPHLNGLIPPPNHYCACGTPKERGGE
jgi:hypothetical protein